MYEREMRIEEAARVFRVIDGRNVTHEDAMAVTIEEAERFTVAGTFARFVELNGIRLHEGVLR